MKFDTIHCADVALSISLYAMIVDSVGILCYLFLDCFL
jgi:hypothetical protein